MKFQKKSISLPEDAVKHAEKKAAKLAKARGSKVTLSSYLSELVVEDKRRGELETQQAA